MKAAYILSATDQYGGASKSFMQLLKGLVARGVSPLVVVPDRKGLYQDLRQMGIDPIVLTYRMAAFPPLKSLTDVILFLPRLAGRILVNHTAQKRLAARLSGQHVDLIHTNVSVIDIGFKAARKLGIPHVYHIREYGDKEFNISYFPSWNHFHNQLRAANSYSVCITKDIQKHHKQGGSPSSCVIYNGIQPTQSTLPEQGEKRFFLFAGRIQPAKGLDLLLRAYAIYTKWGQPIPLHIAGEVCNKAYHKNLLSIVNANKLESLVCFLGRRDDLPQLMRQAHAIIIPSPAEGFGRCMAEAMFNGCLSIGRNTGGTKEQLDNGLKLTGKEIALRFDSTKHLAECLKHAECMSKEEKDGYIERAFHTVNTLYSVESNVDEVLKFYNRIIG